MSVWCDVMGVQCERKLGRLVKSVDLMKGRLEEHHKEHGRLKTEEQVRQPLFPLLYITMLMLFVVVVVYSIIRTELLLGIRILRLQLPVSPYPVTRKDHLRSQKWTSSCKNMLNTEKRQRKRQTLRK